MTKRRSLLLETLAIAAAYFLCAAIGLSLRGSNTASPIWPATGVALALVLLIGQRALVGIGLGALLAAILAFPGMGSWPMWTVIVAGKVLTIAVGANLFRKWVSPTGFPETASQLLGLVAVAAVMNLPFPFLSGVFLIESGRMAFPYFPRHILSWWLADVSMVFLITPLVIAWAKPDRQTHFADFFEHFAVIGAFVLANFFLLATHEQQMANLPALALPFSIFFIWAAFRSSMRVLLTMLFLRSAVALWPSFHGMVPFQAESVFAAPMLSANIATQALVYLLLGIMVRDQDRSRDALSQSSAQLNTLADLAPVGIILTTPDQRVSFVNRYVKSAFGVSSEMISGDGWKKFVHPDDIETVLKHMAAEITGSFEGFTELRAINKKGETRWFLRAGKPIRNPKGRVLSHINVFTDITEQRVSAEKYRQSFEHAPDGILLAGTDGRYIYGNPAIYKMLGYEADELIGKTPFDIVDPEQHEALRIYLESVMKDGHLGAGADWRLYRKDGTILVVEVASKRMPDGRRLVFFRDTSERSAMEAEIRESEEKYRRMVELAPEGIFLAKEHKWVDVNSAACKMLGYTREELIGQGTLEVIAPEDREKVLANRRRTAYTYEVTHMRVHFVRKDGTTIPVEVNAMHWPDGHRQAFATEITDRIKMEENLLKSREQLQALAARTQTAREEEAARISRELHDELGQSLTVLKMQASRMDRNLARNGLKEFKDMRGLREELMAIMTSIDENMHTVRRLSMELRPSVFDHFGLAAALEWQAAEFEKKTEIPCSLRIKCDLKFIDRERSFAVFRVLQEALVNVARHSRASKVEISASRLDGQVLFEIHDNGRGITPAQVSDPRALGLLGMRERLMPFAGSVDFHGEMGKGTQVRVSLPV